MNKIIACICLFFCIGISCTLIKNNDIFGKYVNFGQHAPDFILILRKDSTYLYYNWWFSQSKNFGSFNISKNKLTLNSLIKCDTCSYINEIANRKNQIIVKQFDNDTETGGFLSYYKNGKIIYDFWINPMDSILINHEFNFDSLGVDISGYKKVFFTPEKEKSYEIKIIPDYYFVSPPKKWKIGKEKIINSKGGIFKKVDDDW